jgi:hypothetical protein
MAVEFPFKATMDVSDWSNKTQLILRDIDKITQELNRTNQTGAGKALKTKAQDYKDVSGFIKEQIRLVKELRSLEAKTAGRTGSARTQIVGVRGKAAKAELGAQSTPRLITAGADKAAAELEGLYKWQREIGAEMDSLASRAPAAWSRIGEQVARVASEFQRMQQFVATGAEQGLRLGIADAADKEIRKIDDQIRKIEAANSGQGSKNRQRNLDKVLGLERQANDAHRTALQLTDRLAQLKEKTTAAAAKGLSATKEEIALEKQLLRLRDEALHTEDAARRKAEDPKRIQRRDLGAAGVDGTIARLQAEREILVLRQQQASTADAGFIDKNAPGVRQQLDEITKLNGKLLGIKTTETEIDEILRRQEQHRKEAVRLSKEAATRGVRGSLGEKELKANVDAMRPGIDRLFGNVFEDMGRRFTATLQFAISGAFIFGAQKLVREFIDAAVEVERAFADIESALEFDIIDERGTVAFNLQVEKVRQNVLLLANEFNVLPTEANKSAFVMISRFKDTENAMIALRAQLLATKVSTIDQSEVLRALTATAEGFSAAVFDAAGSLDLNDRLLRREAISARLYSDALDLAVQIQQKFGVEVEDTLEGGARATEVFRQMGFTMEETFAIVAATSRELGQTGQQVAERLNRSLGQLTDPKIRDALLDLASASSAFNLQIGDFDSGAEAWKAIVDQFERLEGLDPDAARKVLQIVGQRRELEAVAAALGTADLQQSIVSGAGDAAGAAEERFAFLSRTIVEIIASISTQFQTLAQNFERLGGISSFKILLTAAEGLITAMNKLLEILLDVRDFLDKVSGFGLGSIISQVALLGLALAGALRTTIALRDTFRTLAGERAIGSLASNFFALSGGGRLFEGPRLAASYAREGGATRAFSRGAFAGQLGRDSKSAVSGGLGKLGAFASSHPIATAAVAAGVLALSFKALHDASQALEKSFENFRSSQRAAATAARRQILDEGLTGRDAALVREEARVNTLRASIAGAQGIGQPGLLEYIGSAGLAGFGAASVVPSAISIGAGGPNPFNPIQSVLERAHNPQNVPGTKQYFEAQFEEANRQYLKTQTQGLKESLNDLPDATVDTKTAKEIERIAGTGRVRSGESSSNPIVAAREALNAQVQEGLDLLADDSGSQQDRLLRQDEAAAIFAEVAQKRNEVFAAYSEFIDDNTRSVNVLLTALGQLDNDIILGRHSRQSAAQEALQISKELEQRAKEFEGNGDTEESEAALRESENAYIDYLNRRKETALASSAHATAYADSETQLVAQIAALNREIEKKQSDGEDTLKEEEEKRQAIVQLKNNRRSQATAMKQHSIAMARSYAEKNKATKELITELHRQSKVAAIDKNFELEDQLRREAETTEKQRIDDAREEAIKANEAAIRLAGPALSSSQKILADISTAKTRIANARKDNDATRIAEGLVALRELLAQQAQQELQRLTALTLAKVSVRDTLNAQLVQLSSLENAARLSKEVYGASSTEFLAANRSVLSARAALIDLALDLESTNRQLAVGFDVTSALDSATENYIRIARELQIPDLGEVERAALELQLKNAEAAQISAQFNDAMLNLQFQFERGDLGTNAYISSLQTMLAEVDTSTEAGKKLWLQINGLIESLTGEINQTAFNIPGQIRLPTLFEVRRAVQAESLGVNYLDNRQQNIQVFVADDVEVGVVFDAINSSFETEDARYAPGGAGITIGSF